MHYLILLTVLFTTAAFSEDFVEAKKSDFSKLLLNDRWGSGKANTFIEYDFDSDGTSDRVSIEINQTRSRYRVTVYLSSNIESPIILWERSIVEVPFPGIWETMWLKLPGDMGESEFKYFNAPGKDYPYLSEYEDKDLEEYSKAVEYYRSLPVIEATSTEQYPYDIDGMFYCKQQYYYESGAFNRLYKCD